jgi:hypothetical protein
MGLLLTTTGNTPTTGFGNAKERVDADLRQRHDDLTTRLLLPPNGKPGFFRRLFGW